MATGYLCKRCGAESPVGIGYAGTPTVPYPAPGCTNLHSKEAERAFADKASSSLLEAAERLGKIEFIHVTGVA